MIQDLPLELLLSVLDHVGWLYFGRLSNTCRILKKAVDAYVQYHSSVQLTNQIDQEARYDRCLIVDFLELACSHRYIALSIRKIDIWIARERVSQWSVLSGAATRQLKNALAFRPHTIPTPGRRGADVQHEEWLFYVLLMCSNVESITVRTDCELQWSRTAQRLQHAYWRGDRLKNVHITYQHFRDDEELHDIQDIWLLFSAPSLETFIADKVHQGNNLYTGATDRAAMRTIYWPIELEIPSLYHLTYVGQYSRWRRRPWHRPAELPTPRTGPIVSEGFKLLQKLVLRRLFCPDTWFPMILSCFESIKHLEISLGTFLNGLDDSIDPSIPDLRPLRVALDKVRSTLQIFMLDIQVPPQHPRWDNAARLGYISFGSLANMPELRYAILPWYTLLPVAIDQNVDPLELRNARTDPGQIPLPPKLEKLVLNRCELASPPIIIKMVEAVATPTVDVEASVSRGSLGKIVLQAAKELAIAQADFVRFASTPIQISTEQAKVSWDGYMLYDDIDLK